MKEFEVKKKIISFFKDKEGSFVSGEDISSSLGFSRASVWKYITKLREEGYDIEAVPHLGYRLKEAPDKLILATGAKPDRTAFPGGDGKNVVSCLDVMDGNVKPGKHVVVVGDKGVAISTALFLVDKGEYEVSMIGRAKKFGLDVNPSYIWRYMKKLKEGGVKQYPLHKIKALTPEGVVADDPEKNEVLISCDTIVLANMASDNELQFDKCDVYTVGDAMVPRRANGAIHDGYRLAMTF